QGGDIRRQGSGNIGATNVLRVGGTFAGVATFVLDAGKGAVAVLMTRSVAGSPWDAAAAFAAVLGHCYPVFLRVRGGEGVATRGGAYARLAPVPIATSLAVFTTTPLTSRMVSAGSMAAGVVLPLAVLWLRPEPALRISVLAAAVLVIARHHANIRRILGGKEHRIRES